MASVEAGNNLCPSRAVPRRPAVAMGVVCPLILIGAGLVRICAARGDFWLDEIWSWNIAAQVSSGWDILTSVHHDNNHYLNTWFMHLLGPDQALIVYRIPAVIAGIGAVAVAGLIGARKSRLETISAMLLMGGSYLQVHYSSEARGYSGMIFFALLAFYLLDRSLRGAGLITKVLFAGSVMLGFLAHLQFVFCYLGLVAWSLWRLTSDRRQRKQLLRINLQCHLVPAIFVGWLCAVDVLYMEIGGGDQNRIADVVVELLSLTVGGPASGPVAILLAVAVVVAALFALVQMRRDGSDEWVFYLTTVLIAPVCIPLVMQHELFFLRYFLICSTFALLLVNHTLVWISRVVPLGRTLFALIVLAMLVGDSIHVNRLLRLGRGQYQQALQLINDRTQGPVITIGSDHPFRNPMVLEFYQRRLTNPKPIQYHRNGEGFPHEPEWFLRHDVKQETDPLPEFQDIIGNRYELTEAYPYAGLSGWQQLVYHKVE